MLSKREAKTHFKVRSNGLRDGDRFCIERDSMQELQMLVSETVTIVSHLFAP